MILAVICPATLRKNHHTCINPNFTSYPNPSADLIIKRFYLTLSKSITNNHSFYLFLFGFITFVFE